MDEPKKKTSKAVVERIGTLLLSAFGLVAALAWNDAIQSFFQRFFDPQGAAISAKFIYAIAITIIITIVSIKLSQYLGSDEEGKS